MPFQNLKASHYSEEEMQSIADLLFALEAKLKPKFTDISSAELKKYEDIDEQNLLAINEIEDYRISHPHLCNPNVDWEEFQADHDSSVFLELTTTVLQHIISELSINKTLHRYNRYEAALRDYEYSDCKACRYVPGYQDKISTVAALFNDSKIRQEAS